MCSMYCVVCIVLSVYCIVQHYYLWDPQGAADVDPFAAAAGGFHGSAFFRAQLAFGGDA